MPIYEYICTKCGHEWDTIQKFSEKPLTNCPKCSKKAAKRKISASAFHLKGSGWYVTDYKSGGTSKDGGDSAATETESKGDAKEAAPKADSNAEAKPDAKSTAKAETRSVSKTASKSVPGKKKKSKTASA